MFLPFLLLIYNPIQFIKRVMSNSSRIRIGSLRGRPLPTQNFSVYKQYSNMRGIACRESYELPAHLDSLVNFSPVLKEFSHWGGDHVAKSSGHLKGRRQVEGMHASLDLLFLKDQLMEFLSWGDERGKNAWQRRIKNSHLALISFFRHILRIWVIDTRVPVDSDTMKLSSFWDQESDELDSYHILLPTGRFNLWVFFVVGRASSLQFRIHLFLVDKPKYGMFKSSCHDRDC